MLSVNELEQWLVDPTQPKAVVYHVGQLSRDRLRYEVHDGRMLVVTFEPLHSIAERLYDLAEQGKIMLVQKRVQPFVWEYIAIRKGK